MSKSENESEHISNLYQKIRTLEEKCKNMTELRSDFGLEKAATSIAKEIDDVYAVGGRSVAERRNCIQVLVRDNMRKMLEGERHWDHT